MARRSTKSTSTGTSSGTGTGTGTGTRKPASKAATSKPETAPKAGDNTEANTEANTGTPGATTAAKAASKTAAAAAPKAEDKATTPASAPEKAAPDGSATRSKTGPKPTATDTGAPDSAPAGGRAKDTSAKSIPGSAVPAADKAAAVQPPAKRGGPVPLLLGGVAAGAIGFGAAYFGFGPAQTGTADLTTQTNAQAEEIGTLRAEIERISSQPAIDLTGLEAETAAATAALTDLQATLVTLEDRVAALEARPVLTGDAEGDTASVIGALDAMQAQLAEQEAQNAAMADDMRRIAEETQASITAAEARAQENLAAAQAQATLSQLRAALASGAPFAGLLADLPEILEVPAPLAAAAETGVPRLADLQTRFPVAARAALPVAIRETAAETDGGNRLGAFLRSQLGIRSITPRDGDDPDAVLSRAQAAVSAGNLTVALDEIAALPEAGQAELAQWAADARARVGAEAALDALAAALQTLN